jgi:hypothetical protein
MHGGRMQQTMPEDRTGWHLINAGPHVEILFHPDRRPVGREPDQVERPSIVVAVAGKREQALRFDPFSMGAHYHIRRRALAARRCARRHIASAHRPR